MKAERRHELQTNALAKVVKRAPETWHQYGGRILLVVVAAALVFFLVRYQITTSRQNRAQAADSLAMSRQHIDRLRDTLAGPGMNTPQQVASIRRQSAGDAEIAINTVITLEVDRSITAEALVARGDLNWTLATLPELPGAATQPTLKYERDPKALLDLAAESYDAVLTQYSDQAAAVTAAHFGLAAIAENRGNWEEARKHYDTLEKNENAGAAYRTQARIRLASIDRFKNAPMIAPPATAPATLPTQAGIPVGPLGPVLATQATTAPVDASQVEASPAAPPATATAAAPPSAATTPTATTAATVPVTP